MGVGQDMQEKGKRECARRFVLVPSTSMMVDAAKQRGCMVHANTGLLVRWSNIPADPPRCARPRGKP